MTDVRSRYFDNINSLLERAADRSFKLDDLDPYRKNTREVASQMAERMRADFSGRALSVESETDYVTEDLVGTKDGNNPTFSISNSPKVSSLVVVHNNAFVTRTTGTAQNGEYSISGTVITMGLVPIATDTLWAQYVKA